MKLLILTLITLTQSIAFASTTLENYTANYDGKYVCDTSVEVSGNTLILTGISKDRNGNVCGNNLGVRIFRCDSSTQRCKLQKPVPPNSCSALELMLLDNGNIVMLDYCNRYNYKYYRY